MFVERTDVATLQPARRLEDGRLVADALITKPGIFEYPDAKYPGGVRRELRPRSEVYSRETMDSFANLPVTQGHPPKLLTSKTARIYSVGLTGDKVVRAPVENDCDWLKTTVTVLDENTINRMDAGDNATSSGYKCILIEKGGVDPEFGRYDVIQTKIRGNHQAVAIPEGRAGSMARVRMDDFGSYGGDVEEPPTLVVMTTATDGHQHTLEPNCDAGCTSGAFSDGADVTHRHEWVRTVDGTIRIAENAGHTHEIDATTLGTRSDAANKFGVGRPAIGVITGSRSDAGDKRLGGMNMDPEKLKETVRTLEAGLKSKEAEVTTVTARADAAEQARDTAVGRIDQLEKEIAALRIDLAAGATAAEAAAVQREKVRADSAEEKIARFDETLDKRIRARTKIMHNASLVMGEEFRMDDLSDRAILCAMVKRMDSTADVTDSVPDGVIAGMCDQLLKRKLSRAREDARIADLTGRDATTQTTRTDSKAEKMRDYRNQAKKPLSELIGRKGA